MPVIPFDGPFIGLNTRKESSKLSQGEAEFCENVDLDRGTVKTRPGHAELESISGLPLGAFDYRKSDGTVVQLVKIGAQLYSGALGSLATVTGAGSLSATNMAEFVGFNDRVYFADGASGLMVTDGTNAYAAQIARPTTKMTVATGSGSAVQRGDYDYKYTYYSTTWGQESPASPVSSVLTVGTNVHVVMDDWDVTTNDVRVDKFRIYRRDISASETLWRHVKDIAIPATSATEVTDTARDNDVSRTIIAPLSVANPVPAAVAHLTLQSGVMLAVEEDSNTVYYSLPARPWFMVNSIPVGSDKDADPVVALFNHGGLAYAAKRQSLWVISGNTEDTIGSFLISDEGGCYAANSVVHGMDATYWVGENTAWIFDGDKPREISDPVEPEFSGRVYSRDPFLVGAYDYDCKAVVWSYTPAGQTTNTKQLVYFERNSKLNGTPSWAFWALGTISTLLRYTDATSKDRLFMYATSAGSLRKLAPDTDDAGTAVKITWRTGKQDYGLPTKQKTFHDIDIEGAHSAASARLGVRYRIDGSDIVHESGEFWDPKLRAVKRVHLGRRARDFRLEVYSTAGLVEVTGWSMTLDAAGRRL